MLKDIFSGLTKQFSGNQLLTDSCWLELELNYSHKKRHYHNLSHLENLIAQLEQVKPQITGWNAVLFAVFYHDAIYKATSNKNEEESAELAKKRLTELNVPQQTLQQVYDLIMATKGHTISNNNDINLFTDADLSILGFDWNTYHTYAQQIRKEYAIYPDLMYNPGRKKVLNHFLAMPRIFKTQFFYHKYEAQARLNLKNELEII